MPEGSKGGTEVLVNFYRLICREKVGGSQRIPLLTLKGELEMITKEKFTDWLSKSKRNDRITYYRGFLFAPHLQKLSPMDEKRPAKIRAHAWYLHMSGLIELVQKKHADFDYEYIAIRR